MDYEKKYKEAFERARDYKNDIIHKEVPVGTHIMDYIFPELAESEDERTRKAIIDFFETQDDNTTYSFVSKKDIVAWLEKQGEQKPADKVKAKFKVGDWVVFNNKHQSIYQVEKTKNGYYILRHTHGGILRACVLHDKSLRLWTIQDVKDGDVLAYDNDTIVIFKDLYNATTFHSYCHIEDGVFNISKEEMPDWWEGEGFKPAKKEQRDLLFQKMKEGGYEWNAEKKELKKVHNALEVKEVNLMKEIYSYIESSLTGNNPIYTKGAVSNLIDETAKHFFELGRKAQKRE